MDFLSCPEDIYYKILINLYPVTNFKLVCKTWNKRINKMQKNWKEFYQRYASKPTIFEVSEDIERDHKWIASGNEEVTVLFITLSDVENEDGSLKELGKAMLYCSAGLEACKCTVMELRFDEVLEMDNAKLEAVSGIIFVTTNEFAIPNDGYLSVLNEWYKKVYIEGEGSLLKHTIVSSIIKSGILLEYN